VILINIVLKIPEWEKEPFTAEEKFFLNKVSSPEIKEKGLLPRISKKRVYH